MFRRQLPAYSPLRGARIGAAVLASGARAQHEESLARQLIAREFATDDVVLVDSGRSALALAISILTGGRGVVGLPAFQCFEVASAAVAANCEIALYDIDPQTLAPDFDSLESLFRSGVETAVIAPLYGVPVDWDKVRTLAVSYGARVVEDAAQGLGARWNGRTLGTLGDVSVLSFGRGKGWTGGAGGAVCLRGDLSDRLRGRVAKLPRLRWPAAARIAATTMAQWALGRPSLYGIPAAIPGLELGQTIYHAPDEPRSLSPFSAALLRRTWDLSAREQDVRRRNAELWKATLPIELQPGMTKVDSRATPGYLRLPLRLPQRIVEFAESAAARANGIARSYPSGLFALEAVAKRLVGPAKRFPGAQSLVDQLVTLPTHSFVGDRDRRVVGSLVRHWLARD